MRHITPTSIVTFLICFPIMAVLQFMSPLPGNTQEPANSIPPAEDMRVIVPLSEHETRVYETQDNKLSVRADGMLLVGGCGQQLVRISGNYIVEPATIPYNTQPSYITVISCK